MNNLFKDNKILMAFAIIAIISLSACNRGVGCPSDFSMAESILNLISNLF